MTELVEIYKPSGEANAYGVVEQGWTLVATSEASIRYLRGGETVQAARLAGRQPAIITVPVSSAALQITTDWRIRDLRDERDYNVRAVVPTDARDAIEITAESGVAV